MFKRLAKKIAQKHMELRQPQQPLRLQPDYGERNAADFLGEKTVQLNTGYGDLKSGPGNYIDDVVADDFEADELEGFEIVDDIGLGRMSDFWKESRLPSRKHNSDKVVDTAVAQWKKDNPEVAEKFEDEVVHSEEEMNEKMKSADDEIIDDIGLGRMAGGQQIGSGSNGYIAMWNREKVEVYADSKFEAQEMAQAHFQKGTRKRIKGYDVTVMLAEKGGSQVTHRPMFASDDEIIDDIGLGRTAKDHEDSGSYMSRQNLREMSDMADFIVDDIGLEDLDDWVEDKISQSYSAMNDVARYRGYRDDDQQGSEDIIDDMGFMADFDKESKYSKGEKGQEEYANARRDGDVPEDFLEYEGSVTSPGQAPDPSLVEKNRDEMGKKARYYDIIDDLEW